MGEKCTCKYSYVTLDFGSGMNFGHKLIHSNGEIYFYYSISVITLCTFSFINFLNNILIQNCLKDELKLILSNELNILYGNDFFK